MASATQNAFSAAKGGARYTPTADFLPVRPETFDRTPERENVGILSLPKGGNKEDLMRAMDAAPSYEKERTRQHPNWPRLEMSTEGYATKTTTKGKAVTRLSVDQKRKPAGSKSGTSNRYTT